MSSIINIYVKFLNETNKGNHNMDSTQKRQKNVETLQHVLSLLENSQSKKALEVLQSAHFIDDFALIKKQIEAEILVSLNEHNRAECAYLGIIREHPENTDTKFALSQLYQKNGRLSQARTILDEVIALDAAHFMAWNNKGNIERSLKNYDAAIECYKKSLEIEPGYTVAMNNLCLIYSETQRYQEVIDLGLQAIEDNPQTISVYEIMHNAYIEMNHTQEAYDLIDLAIKQCGEDPRLTTLSAG